MEQLVLDIVRPEPPRFANFLPGRNAELIAALTRFVGTPGDETGMLLWGAPGVGKTHLLQAAVAQGRGTGREAWYFSHPATIGEPGTMSVGGVIAIDRIDVADEPTSARIFTLFNAVREAHGSLLAASRTPLAALSIREDLRTRLGWGLVYEVVALSDEDKPEALAAYARERGFGLSPETIDYLLRHARRDMASLVGMLAALDRYSLSAKRPITVPLLREWLQREAKR